MCKVGTMLLGWVGGETGEVGSVLSGLSFKMRRINKDLCRVKYCDTSFCLYASTECGHSVLGDL